MRDVGKNIRQCRIAKNLTQDGLAERIHTTRQTISNYETGRSRPDIDTLMLLAEVLEVDLERLLSGTAKPTIDALQLRHLLWCAGLTVGVLLLDMVLGMVCSPILSTRYRLPLPLLYTRYLSCFLWPTLLGWTVMQASLTLRLLRSRSSRWVYWFVLTFAAFYTGSFFLPVVPFTHIWRNLMVHHLFPTEFWGRLVLVIMGAAIRFTKEA